MAKAYVGELLALFGGAVMIHPQERVNDVLHRLSRETGVGPEVEYLGDFNTHHTVTFSWSIPTVSMPIRLSIFGNYETEADAKAAMEFWAAGVANAE